MPTKKRACIHPGPSPKRRFTLIFKCLQLLLTWLNMEKEKNEIQPAVWHIARITLQKIFRLLARLLETTWRKYFDYLIFNIVNCGLLRSGARRRALAQTIGNVRRLDINSPRSVENYPQDLRLHQHQQHDDPNSARGLDNNFASDRDCDSTTTTRLRYCWLRRADHAEPDKS
jgi:hypothetical protein